MKKIVFSLLFVFLLTGCFFGEVGSGYLTKTCTKNNNYSDVSVTENKIIKYKDNKVIAIIFDNLIKAKKINDTFRSIKNTYMSEMANLKSFGINTNEITNSDNEYHLSYEFDFNNLDESIKSKYSFDEVSYKQIKKYEEEGYNCK